MKLLLKEGKGVETGNVSALGRVPKMLLTGAWLLLLKILVTDLEGLDL